MRWGSYNDQCISLLWCTITLGPVVNYLLCLRWDLHINSCPVLQELEKTRQLCLYLEHPIIESWHSVTEDMISKSVQRMAGRRSGHTALLWSPVHLHTTLVTVFYMSNNPTSVITFFLFKWVPVGRDLWLTSAPTCTHLPTFFSHWGMTITRYHCLIK